MQSEVKPLSFISLSIQNPILQTVTFIRKVIPKCYKKRRRKNRKRRKRKRETATTKKGGGYMLKL